ncbi:hypothetical protein [Succinimonas sp.]|uniref:hypothetical protein n=1 Tax=Succinimonas sp. TaxID=1936151 RepID=UPI0038651EA8
MANNIKFLTQSMVVYSEKLSDRGEDAAVLKVNDTASLAGVFDGLGGSGARSYSRAEFKSGAYLASRVAALTVRDWFKNLTENSAPENFDFGGADKMNLKKMIKDSLLEFKSILKEEQVTRLKSSFSKELPTTMAIQLIVPLESESKYCCQANFLWAGDSRGYIFDEDGLHQITEDDNDVADPFENISADGKMTNVIYAGGNFTVHFRSVPMKKPFLSFVASDGCFGYFSSPMEFEYHLLRALVDARSFMEAEHRLYDCFEARAEDDFSFAGLFYYGERPDIFRKHAKNRLQKLEPLIARIRTGGDEARRAIWQEEYRAGYLRFQ